MTRTLLVGLWWILVAAGTVAQGPEADWRTLETEHYRIHFTAPAEDWTRRAAAQIEEIYRRVAEEVGHAPVEVTDVLVLDPVAQANGVAWPILGWPRMVLWTSSPGPASVIGHYRDWGELLLTHEQAHLAHLLRPSRNPHRAALERLVPIGALAMGSPRWLSEGYATYVEGRLTGFGRPHGDLRATILRRWAQSGELPSYAALDGDVAWLGMSMAYLVGSAYLEWLVDREGEDSLRKLWARQSARRQRSFGEAFTGVFGDSPERLYNRFRAELTYRAMVLERTFEAADQIRQGELWQDLAWSTGPPAISPDGERLAIVLRSRDKPARLVVWSTNEDIEAAEARRRQEQALLAADPLDVPARSRRPPAREPLYELEARAGAAPFTPRWSADGQSLIYVRYEPDGRGVLHPDLFRWTPAHRQVERLTRGADLRDPDPAAKGGWAVAVRRRHGQSQLVRVDLEEGAVEPLFEATVAEVHDHPRLDPQGARLAYVRHRNGSWQLVVRQLESGVEQVLPTPNRATVAYPAWSADGRRLWASIGEGGFISIRSFELTTSAPPVVEIVVQSQGAALAPAPSPAGHDLFYLDLQPEGLDLRRLTLGAAGSRLADRIELPAESLAPAVRPSLPGSFEAPPRSELAADKPYGVGRLELLPLLGGRMTSSESSLAAGMRLGDVIGRLDLLVLAADSASAPAGLALAGVWRGWPWEFGGHVFDLQQRPSRQRRPNASLAGSLDLDQRGVELSLARAWRRRASATRLHLSGSFDRVELLRGDEQERQVVGLQLTHRADHGRRAWRLEESIDLSAQLGRTAGESWRRWNVGVEAGLVKSRGGPSLKAGWWRGEIDGGRFDFDRFQLGGVASTLLPALATAQLIEQPALPTAALLGDRHEAQRFSISKGSLPIDLFWQRHRLESSSGAGGEWLALWGAELHWRGRPRPLLRLPALDLRLGFAEVLDEPLEGSLAGWLSLGWRP